MFLEGIFLFLGFYYKCKVNFILYFFLDVEEFYKLVFYSGKVLSLVFKEFCVYILVQLFVNFGN